MPCWLMSQESENMVWPSPELAQEGMTRGHSSWPPVLLGAQGCGGGGVITSLNASNMCPINSDWNRMKLLSEGLAGGGGR